MRTPYIAGNWKMNLERKSALGLAAALREHVGRRQDVDVAVFPPFVYIDEIARALGGSPIRVGAQNCCDESSGAFTGEVSAAMLVDVGAEIVILGHSERRHIYGESDELVNRKVHAALDAGIEIILCVGETLEERERGVTEAVVGRQLDAVLAVAGVAAFARAILAYEPVWAIGTGKNATPEQAQAVHAFIRTRIAARDATIADGLRLLYGGSVKAANAAELFDQPDVDGGLVGGASLKADEFVRICAAAA